MNNGVVMQNYKVNVRTWVFTLLCGTVFLASLILQDITFFLLAILFSVLIGYLFFQRDINLFEPFTLFTLYYFTVPLAGLHLHVSNFRDTVFVQQVGFSNDPKYLLNLALIYLVIGYIFTLIGYKTFAKRGRPQVILNDDVSHRFIWLIIIGFSVLGTVNFIFNIYTYAGGNIFVYFSNLSVRYLEFQEIEGTTLGYLFAYSAAYLWFYIVLKNKRFSMPFVLFLFLTILMKASSGRVFQTLVYTASFFVIYYLTNIDYSRRNLTYLLIGGLTGLAGISLYFFRITSSMMYSNMAPMGWSETFLSFIDWEVILNSAVDKGNIPNIAVFMKIIDSWQSDIGFLYGESLFSWAFQVIPSSIRPIGYQPSVMIKEMWYSHIRGGALPPTGIGEMYANFGIFGPFLGMFFFGAFCAFIYNMLFKFNNYWYLTIYTQISLGFIMIYPKGEFDNFPFVMVLILLLVFMLIKFSRVISRKI